MFFAPRNMYGFRQKQACSIHTHTSLIHCLCESLKCNKVLLFVFCTNIYSLQSLNNYNGFLNTVLHRKSLIKTTIPTLHL